MYYRIYPVKIKINNEEKVYSEEFQTRPEYSAAWRSVLSQAYGNADLRCTCPGFGKKKLSVRYMSNSGKFYLARYPRSSSQHYIDCVFYDSAPDQSGIGEYKKGVIKETPGGYIRVKTQIGFTKDKNSSRRITVLEKGQNNSDRYTEKSAMTLLGLLHLLWTKTRLNCWTPGMDGKRNIDIIHYWIDKISEKITTGRIRLFDVLLIATSRNNKGHIHENIRKVSDAYKKRHRVVIIAPLAAFNPDRKNKSILPIAYFYGIPIIRIKDDFWDEKARHFDAEISAWQKGNRIIVIVLADTNSRELFAVDTAFMRVTPRWIPVESDFEAMLEEKLYRESRVFEKPLKYDASHKIFPDFRLWDVEKYYPMNIFDPTVSGLQKSKKIEYYHKRYKEGGWWMWDVSASENIPEFPEQTQKLRVANNFRKGGVVHDFSSICI